MKESEEHRLCTGCNTVKPTSDFRSYGKLCAKCVMERDDNCKRRYWARIKSSNSQTYERHSLRSVWKSMIKRCHNPNDPNWKWYGGKGITVCSEWRSSFDTFLKNMGDRPKGYFIDRIDNSIGYCPENCRWVTPAESTRNSSNTHWFTWNGKTQCVMDWAKEAGLNYNTVLQRILAGWPPGKVFSQPRKRKSNDSIA